MSHDPKATPPVKVRISLTLTFETPPSVGAGGASVALADKVVTRDAGGRFVIPASQVKGKLRHACEQLLRAQTYTKLCRAPKPERMCPNVEGLASPCLLCSIFGSPHDRSRLRFHDLVAAREDLPDDTFRSMVSLSRARRTAEAQRLFLIETAPNVRGLEFKNDHAITGHIAEAAHAQLLLAGLKLLFSWGGGASRGLGWAIAETEAWANEQPLQLNIEEVKALCQS